MKTQLQKVEDNENIIIEKKSFFKENFYFLWKTGLQSLMSGVAITSLIITGGGIVPIVIFSGSVIVGNVLSIWAEKTRKKSIKKFFQEWNNQLDKQLAIEKIKLARSNVEQDILNKQLAIEKIKLARSNVEQDILNKQLAIEKIKLASSNQNELAQSKLNNDGHHQQETLSNLGSNINQRHDDVIFAANNLEKEMNFKYKTTIKITFIKNKI